MGTLEVGTKIVDTTTISSGNVTDKISWASYVLFESAPSSFAYQMPGTQTSTIPIVGYLATGNILGNSNAMTLTSGTTGLLGPTTTGNSISPGFGIVGTATTQTPIFQNGVNIFFMPAMSIGLYTAGTSINYVSYTYDGAYSYSSITTPFLTLTANGTGTDANFNFVTKNAQTPTNGSGYGDIISIINPAQIPKYTQISSYCFLKQPTALSATSTGFIDTSTGKIGTSTSQVFNPPGSTPANGNGVPTILGGLHMVYTPNTGSSSDLYRSYVDIGALWIVQNLAPLTGSGQTASWVGTTFSVSTDGHLIVLSGDNSKNITPFTNVPITTTSASNQSYLSANGGNADTTTAIGGQAPRIWATFQITA
jgi:hypothetical protein